MSAPCRNCLATDSPLFLGWCVDCCIAFLKGMATAAGAMLVGWWFAQ